MGASAWGGGVWFPKASNISLLSCSNCNWKSSFLLSLIKLQWNHLEARVCGFNLWLCWLHEFVHSCVFPQEEPMISDDLLHINYTCTHCTPFMCHPNWPCLNWLSIWLDRTHGMDAYTRELMVWRWTTAVNVPVALACQHIRKLWTCVQHSTVKIMNIN